ncbi:MAG: methylenetetrahydrofolate reductase C-terminal domain-containing protein, partial [Blastococcus sp.]
MSSPTSAEIPPSRRSRGPGASTSRDLGRRGRGFAGGGWGHAGVMDDAGCPKRMVFGPCGGVRDDGGCELADHRCVFLD